MLGTDRSSQFTGATASYVALSAVTIIALASLCSVWTADVSGSFALLGLVGVYIASQELLVLFMGFSGLSILVDLMMLGGPTRTSGRGWLIFLQLLEMAAKAAGSFFAFQLWKSVSVSGDYAAAGASSSTYHSSAPLHQQQQQQQPASVPIPGTSAYQRVHDPFAGTPAAYSPPPPSSQLSQGASGASQQPQQQPQLVVAAAPAAPPPAPAAPHHDLV